MERSFYLYFLNCHAGPDPASRLFWIPGRTTFARNDILKKSFSKLFVQYDGTEEVKGNGFFGALIVVSNDFGIHGPGFLI